MKLTQTLAAVVLASVTGLSFAAEAAAPATPAPAAKEAAKPAKHHKHHAKKEGVAKKEEAATPAK